MRQEIVAPDAKASFGQSAGERDLTGLERVKEAVDDDGEVAAGERIQRRKAQIGKGFPQIIVIKEYLILPHRIIYPEPGLVGPADRPAVPPPLMIPVAPILWTAAKRGSSGVMSR